MTETQAKSGGTGASANPVDEEPAEGGAAATGRAAVGRAVVPADAPSPPKFTRAPGMAPPPDEPPADSARPSEAARPAAGKAAAGSAAPGKSAPGSPAPGNPAAPGGSAPGNPASGAAGSGGLAGPNAKATATVPIVTKGKKGGAVPVTGGGPAQGKSGGTGRTGTMPTVKPGTAPARPAGPTPGRSGAQGDDPKRPAGAASGSAAVGAARVSEAARSPRSPVSSAAARGPRRARLNLKRIDPWSVMKFSFAVSIVLFIVVVVATSVLYLSLDAMGVWEKVNTSFQDLVNASGGTPQASGGFRITAWGVIGTSMLIGAVNVVLFTALATLGAFIYNVCADLVGGVELTLAERD